MYTPAKRRYYAPPMTAKRLRMTQTGRYRQFNRKTAQGPRVSGTLEQQVKSLQRVVKNLAPELKMVDVDLAITDCPTTGFATSLLQIAAGDGISDRTGVAINVTGIAVRGEISAGADIPLDGILRFAIVQNLQQVSDAGPTVTDIFVDGSATFALPSLSSIEKFKVLWVSQPYDVHRLALDTDLTNVVATQTNIVEHNWKGNIKVTFNGTGSTDIEKNGIYFVMLNSVGAATLDFTGKGRVSFTDV